MLWGLSLRLLRKDKILDKGLEIKLYSKLEDKAVLYL